MIKFVHIWRVFIIWQLKSRRQNMDSEFDNKKISSIEILESEKDRVSVIQKSDFG